MSVSVEYRDVVPDRLNRHAEPAVQRRTVGDGLQFLCVHVGFPDRSPTSVRSVRDRTR
jgi:hypothetical protein